MVESLFNYQLDGNLSSNKIAKEEDSSCYPLLVLGQVNNNMPHRVASLDPMANSRLLFLSSTDILLK